MLNKGKQKKGSSLIEIIISIALLSILMIPLSSAIIQLVKINKGGEVKQIASYEGQKILEEFKGYDEIKLVEGKFELLNGEKLIKISENQYEANFKVTNKSTVYNVDLSVVKNDIFDSTVKEVRDKVNINFDENNKVFINNKEINFRSNYLRIKIDNLASDLSRYKIEFYSTDNESQVNPNYSITVENLHLKDIVINVGREYTKDLNIKIENNTSNKNEINFETNIYKSENKDHEGIVDVSSIKGNNIVRINRNLEVGANGTLEQLYTINVNVKEEGKSESLFESSNTKNIIIS